MDEWGVLGDLVIVFTVAVFVVLILRRARIPSIAAFIVAGALVGPRAFSLIKDYHQVELLAEVGVVLLLFSIGLELSLERMRRLWRPIVIAGAFQVGATILIAVGATTAIGFGIRAAIFTGFLVALSSTAIVLRSLQQRDELEAPHGRFTIGVLVFQDLCVVPMLLAIPFLSGSAGSIGEAGRALAKTVIVITAVLLATRIIVPRILFLVAKTRQRDLFVLVVFTVCVGTAWVLSLFGISVALGAFMAGLVVSGSAYRHQALSDVIPFREVLTSLFFISVGMLLDPRFLMANIAGILLILAAVLVVKFLIVLCVARMAQLPLRAGILAGTALAQIGEFAFVLRYAAEGTNLLPPTIDESLLAAAILSMLITPLLLAVGPKLAAGVGRVRMLNRMLDIPSSNEFGDVTRLLRDHVIIAGYGVAGQELGRSLDRADIEYVVVDLNPETVRSASRSGVPICFGDITSAEVQHQLGIDHARELVMVVNDPAAAERAVKAVRANGATLHVIVRSRYLLDSPTLLAAGASEVVPAELEAAVQVTQRVLARHGVAGAVIGEQVMRIRQRGDDQPLKAPDSRET